MDILAHGLWAGAAAKTVNLKKRKPISTWWTVSWGIFPDLFAFTIPVVWILWRLSFRGLHFSDLPRVGHGEPPPIDNFWVFRLSHSLYNWSHSAIIFAIVFLLVWAILKHIPWEMGGWLIHILIDIPTHTYRFYPTPFLWPISGVKFSGFSWATPRFLMLNYSAIILVYIWLLRREKNRRMGKN